jgi:hypothetical protein
MRLVVVGVIALLVSCGRNPEIQEEFYGIGYSPIDISKAHKEAPIIIEGTVTAVSLIGNPIRSRHEPRVLLNLTRVTLRPEAVLRGEPKADGLVFYYYAYSSSNTATLGGGVRTCEFRVNERRLVFLMRESETLRTVSDVTDCGSRVYSGSHKHGQLPWQFEKALATVMLVPEAGIDVEKFVSHLQDSLEEVQRLTSRAVTAKFLIDLTRSSDSRISAAACLRLAENFQSTTGCLDDLESSVNTSEEIRARARELSKRIKMFWSSIQKPLITGSLTAFPRMSPVGQHALLDEIKVYSLSPDPVVHAAACALIKREFPSQFDWEACKP